MDDSLNSILPGEVIDGKYTIGRVIGSGGMGTVYEAVQQDLDRRVALKILHSKYAKSRKIVERFQQEARLAGTLEHDNICRVTDHGTRSDGAPYLVMPLLMGRSLAKILADGEPLSQMRTIDIVCQTLQALEAAHSAKIVHRDLKPDNIFVTQVGDREDFVKLLDFGISKVLEKNSVSDLTSTGMVLGTAYYLAPEQARGSKRIDHRVDIYAMGVILYEALTGIRPFEGDTYNEVVFKIAGEPVKPPRALNPRMYRGVEQVILKAMAIDPNKRFKSAEEMCEALERAAVGGANEDVSPLLSSTLVDTDVDGRVTLPVAIPPRKLPRFRVLTSALFGILILGLGGAAYIWLGSADDVEEKDDFKEKSSTVAPEKKIVSPTPEPIEEERQETSESSSMSEKSSLKSIVESTPSPKVESSDPAPQETETPEKNEALKPATHPSHRKGGRRQRRKETTKPKQNEIISGPFNTKFVFEED